MPTYRGGRHEHGQNYLTDRPTIAAFTRLVADSTGPIIEIGPGRGALTRELHRLHRPLTAVEIDPRSVAVLGNALPGIRVVHADFLDWRLPGTPHVIAGNVPFHLTTAILRKLLHAPGWSRAVLLVQWEVARRRAAVGGASMMTAQWWPWFEFGVDRRVHRSALRPAPSVDGGILVMDRRAQPLIDDRDRAAYREFVHRVFTGPGRGIAAIAAAATSLPRREAARRMARIGIAPDRLPKDLSAEQWVALFRATHQG